MSMTDGSDGTGSTTIRVSKATRARLKRLKPFNGMTQDEMVTLALDAYEARQQERLESGRAALEQAQSNGGEADTSER